MNYNLGLLGKNIWLLGNEIAIIYSISYCSRSMRGREFSSDRHLMSSITPRILDHAIFTIYFPKSQTKKIDRVRVPPCI